MSVGLNGMNRVCSCGHTLFEKIKNVIDEADELGVFNITLSGGECTIDKDFLKIEFTVRKAAHVCLFAVLGSIFCGYFGEFSVNSKQRILFATFATMGYAALDELHQYYVPDRAARLYDVAIDAAGGLLGATAFFIFMLIINKLINKFKKGVQH